MCIADLTQNTKLCEPRGRSAATEVRQWLNLIEPLPEVLARRPARTCGSRATSKSLLYLISGLISIVLAFVFMAYFVEPRDLLHRLLSLDLKTTGGFAGAVTTLLILLDFLFLRLRFCTVVCPYGYLQGMLADGDTLMVHYRDENRDCIECKKCERICHMGIDIRTSPYQIECVGCGECIDVCNDVLSRLGKQGVIH